MTTEEFRERYLDSFKGKKRPHKYGAKKVSAEGVTFDSEKEYNRWCELSLMERAGVITGLQRQVVFTLIPAQREPDTVGSRGGVKKGKVIERPVTYKADFVYQKDGETIVEDTKGLRTREYIIKRKLMLYILGIRILET